jgi:hypothetical protein
MYRINENLSKEENLELAKAYQEQAKDIVERFDAIVKEANKFCPGNTYGLSKSQLVKHQSPTETRNRLSNCVTAEWYVKSVFSNREREAKEKAEKEVAIERTKKLEAEKSQLLNEAIAFCLGNGKLFGTDFIVENAIQVANDIAFQAKIKLRNEEIGDGYIGFSGQNCEDECAGWNPQDRRCECGNRRVSWTNEYSDFRNMEIYAEAW